MTRRLAREEGLLVGRVERRQHRRRAAGARPRATPTRDRVDGDHLLRRRRALPVRSVLGRAAGRGRGGDRT